MLDGPGVTALTENPRGTPIITDSRGDCWTATITEGVSRKMLELNPALEQMKRNSIQGYKKGSQNPRPTDDLDR